MAELPLKLVRELLEADHLLPCGKAFGGPADAVGNIAFLGPAAPFVRADCAGLRCRCKPAQSVVVGVEFPEHNLPAAFLAEDDSFWLRRRIDKLYSTPARLNKQDAFQLFPSFQA